MESNFLRDVFLPLALFFIMLGMGLGLKMADFKRVFIQPKAVLLGLIAQLIMLPIVGYFLASIFPLSPELAVGVMILAACPGGATSNILTYLVRGNVALSITLTAISSAIAVFTLPIIVNLATFNFMAENIAVQLPFFKTVIQIGLITLIPISLGMLLNHFTPIFAAKSQVLVKWLSLFFLGLIITGLLLKERANLSSFFLQVGGVTFTLNVLTMALGFGIAILARLDQSCAKAITVEVGIQNGTLAILIASAPTFLNNSSMAIPAAIYSLLMFVTSGFFAWWVQNRQNFSDRKPMGKV